MGARCRLLAARPHISHKPLISESMKQALASMPAAQTALTVSVAQAAPARALKLMLINRSERQFASDSSYRCNGQQHYVITDAYHVLGSAT